MFERDAIAEMVRMRWVIGGEVADLDMVMTLAGNEAETLEARPGLSTWATAETRSLPVDIVVWAKPAVVLVRPPILYAHGIDRARSDRRL